MDYERVLQAAEKVMEAIKGNEDCKTEIQHDGEFRKCTICDAIVEYYKIKKELEKKGGG